MPIALLERLIPQISLRMDFEYDRLRMKASIEKTLLSLVNEDWLLVEL